MIRGVENLKDSRSFFVERQELEAYALSSEVANRIHAPGAAANENAIVWMEIRHVQRMRWVRLRARDRRLPG